MPEAQSFIDSLCELLDQIAPILYILIPAAAGIYYKVKTKVKKKEKEVSEAQQARAKELYDLWEHEESAQVISKIKNFCNLYKDKGNVDLVQYLQLENGTMAISKLQNMFLTCLAEDDRFGKVPKLIGKMQRMPYSECSTWLDSLTKCISEGNTTLGTPDLSKAEYNKATIEGLGGKIGSVKIAPVFDPNEILLGICVFYYHEKNYNNNKPESEREQILRFKDSVENVLFVYHQSRANKKKELGVKNV